MSLLNIDMTQVLLEKTIRKFTHGWCMSITPADKFWGSAIFSLHVYVNQ